MTSVGIDWQQDGCRTNANSFLSFVERSIRQQQQQEVVVVEEEEEDGELLGLSLSSLRSVEIPTAISPTAPRWIGEDEEDDYKSWDGNNNNNNNNN